MHIRGVTHEQLSSERERERERESERARVVLLGPRNNAIAYIGPT